MNNIQKVVLSIWGILSSYPIFILVIAIIFGGGIDIVMVSIIVLFMGLLALFFYKLWAD